MRNMIVLAAGCCAAMAASPALAGRYPTCAQAQATVVRQGAAVIYTAPRIYDRYVANRSFCEPTQITKPAFVQTVDNPACLIGSTCIEKESARRWR